MGSMKLIVGEKKELFLLLRIAVRADLEMEMLHFERTIVIVNLFIDSHFNLEKN